MTATIVRAAHEPLTVRLSRWLLTRAVRGRAAQGTTWGEAMLAELEEATTTTEVVRWTLSSLPVAWRERRRRRSAARAAQSRRVRVTRRIVTSLAALLAGGFLVNVFVATITYQAGGSMSPTYAIGSRLLVDKVGYHLTGLRVGDVVTVNVAGQGPTGGDITMLKRVVGLPGDAMACDAAGALTRNGHVIAGPAAAEPPVPPPTAFACHPVIVPAGDVYLLGDNFFESKDSRIFGPVPASGVVGRVVGRIWPW